MDCTPPFRGPIVRPQAIVIERRDRAYQCMLSDLQCLIVVVIKNVCMRNCLSRARDISTHPSNRVILAV